MNRTSRNIKLIVAYDGTEFCGWQRQGVGGVHTGAQRTVQALIETALEKLHKAPVRLAAAGRTDAGVHAAGQVAHFHTTIQSMDAERFVPALNSLLPHDLRILSAELAPPEFHARFDAKSRTYRYHIISGRPALPHELRYALQMWRRPDIARLNSYARLLRGEMDCTLFATPRDPSRSRNRYLFNAFFLIERDTLVFEITANAFLWRMVRSIVGTLLHCEEHNLAVSEFKSLLASGDRKRAGPTAPPQGLFLWKVGY
jgi:tRNA pseudouridine38-40 synthase